MRISDVRVHVVAPMGEQELAPGARLGWVFVEVETDEGVTGIGECSNWPRRGNLLVASAVRALRDEVVGRDPMRIEATWLDLFRGYTYLGNRGLISTVLSGIDIALWDIRGRVLGRPVWDLLGGPVREAVTLYTHPSGASVEAIVASARQLVAEGYTAIKLDPFLEMLPTLTGYVSGVLSQPGLNQAVEVVHELRRAVGADVEIMVDMHGHFDVGSAARAIRALEPFDITWFEEPVPPEGHGALRQLRSQVGANLCVGERLRTRWEFLPVLEERLVNYVMPDVCWTGGISELRKIATLAEAHLVSVSPHDALGPVQIIAGAHAMLVTPNFYRLEINSLWRPMYDHCVRPGMDIRDGVLYLSDRPGLGVELDREYLAEHADPQWVRAQADS